MEKTSTMNIRINPSLKQDAEAILQRLGIPMSTAIDIYLNQIVLIGGLPFSVRLPNAPERIDATRMSEQQIHEKIQKGYESYKAGQTMNAFAALTNFIKEHDE